MKLEKLEKNQYYHIYNRGINSETIFISQDNMDYFLRLFNSHLDEKVNVLAYCLMKNHFHFVINLSEDEKTVIQSLSNFFNAYAKAFNKQQGRTGSLFEKHFRRKRIDSDDYLKNLIMYVHNNPVHHGLTLNLADYRNSSYPYYIGKSNVNSIKIDKTSGLKLFDTLENFKISHRDFDFMASYENELQKESCLDLQGFENLAGRPDENSRDASNLPDSDNLQGLKDLDDSGNLQGLKDLVGLPKTSMKNKFYNYIQTLQDTITSTLEAIDGKAKFKEDLWDRPEGGGGRTRVIENGNVFEKGGVNISAVHGELPEAMQTYFGVKDANFYACGLSLVLHPINPMMPTVHANWRYFEMYDKNGDLVDSWFGGGQDLTPYYLFEEDVVHFHQVCKKACDMHHKTFYPEFKKKCDDYFWNSHRNEARGIGGLFFDYCKATDDMSMDDWYNFVTEVGDSFLEAYVPIVNKRRELPYTKAQRTWQEIRRGRYVEFNLVHDKGTLFGLKTNGRIESILMSLPPKVQWVYDHHPEAGSEEEKLLDVLKNPLDWVKNDETK